MLKHLGIGLIRRDGDESLIKRGQYFFNFNRRRNEVASAENEAPGTGENRQCDQKADDHRRATNPFRKSQPAIQPANEHQPQNREHHRPADRRGNGNHPPTGDVSGEVLRDQSIGTQTRFSAGVSPGKAGS
jgi:hypothetical protein